MDSSPAISSGATQINPNSLLLPDSATNYTHEDVLPGTPVDSVEDKISDVEKSSLEKDIETAVSTFEKNHLINRHKELLEKVRNLLCL